MTDSLSENETRTILDTYENSYLYIDEVPDYRGRRKAFLDRRDRSVAAINAWFRENAPWDDLTRIYKRMDSSSRVSFEYPAESVMLIRTNHLDADAANRMIIGMRDMQPDILILDLRGCHGDDPAAAMNLVGSLTEGEICNQRYRSFVKVTVSRRTAVRPQMIFVFTDKDTRGCACMAVTSLYLNCERVTVIGVPMQAAPIGRDLIEGLKCNPRMVFSLATYRWSVNGRGPEVFEDPDPDRFAVCTSEDMRERMSIVYERMAAGGWRLRTRKRT